MTWLVVTLTLAALSHTVSRWLALPVIPLLMAGGMTLSFLRVRPPEQALHNMVELGLAFLVFTAGLELNPARFQHHWRIVLRVAVAQFALVAAAAYGVSRLLGIEGGAAGYVAMAVSTSSTLVVVHQLKQAQSMFEPFGRLVIGVLLLQDLLMILVIALAAQGPKSAGPAAVAMAKALGLAVLAVACQRWTAWLLNRERKGDDESLLLLVLALLFAMAGLAFHLQMPPEVGAFLAGFALSRFPVNGVVRGLLNSLSDFFQALFFVGLGWLVGIPHGLMLLNAGVLVLLVLFLVPPIVTWLAETGGMASRPSLEAGLLLAQTSEFGLVLILAGSRALGHIPQEILSLVALVTVATMTLTPFLANDRVTTLLLRWHPARRRPPEPETPRDHVLLLGFGASGMWVIKPLIEQGHKILVVDDDPAVIHRLRKAAIPCLRGDGGDETVLARAGATQAKLILASMRRVADAERVLRVVKNAPVLVRVFEAAETERIERLGGIPILNSEGAARTFLEWFEKNQGHPRLPGATAA